MLKILVCFILFAFNAIASSAENNKIKTIVEFFSFKCVHCASINMKLNQYVATNKIKYLDINIDPEALNTMILYYIAIDSGVGVEFKNTYFKAVSEGMVAYSSSTLSYVAGLVQNSAMKRLLRLPEEQQKIKLKMNYAQEMLDKYKVRATPTFLIDQTTLLEGEYAINSLIEAN